MNIWIVLLAIAAIIRIFQTWRKHQHRKKIAASNDGNILSIPISWSIRLEKGTVEHGIAQDTALATIADDGTYETFTASLPDKIEYDHRIRFARKDIDREIKQRLGITTHKKGRRRP